MELTVRTKRQRFDDAINLIEEFLTDFIREKTKEGWSFVVDKHTTNNWEKFKRELEEHPKVMEVSMDGCEKTIYTHPMKNIQARVWHDFCHIELDVDFSFESEVKVAKLQAKQLSDWAGVRGYRSCVIEDAAELIQRDIIDQAAFYKHFGKFVDNQESFIYEGFLSDFEVGHPFEEGE